MKCGSFSESVTRLAEERRIHREDGRTGELKD